MGRKLTRARRQHKLALCDVAEELRISLHYMKALESGRLDELPGAVYALGFIRNYAELVDLDAEELIGMAKDYLACEEEARRPHLPEPHRESRFPARLIIVGATSAMLLFFTTWPMVGSQTESEASMVPLLPAHLAARLEQAAEPDSEVVQMELAKPDSDGQRFLGSHEQIITVEPREFRQEEAQTEIPGRAVPDLEEEQTGGEAPVEIRAIRDTWVVIKNENDQTLLSGVIRSGDSFIMQRTAQLKLSASDGGNLVLYVRGRPVSELGVPGRALRSVRLDVAGLLKGTS
jgi:cytoskeleton protein RodZ